MTSLNSEFSAKASGLPSFGIQDIFTKLADAVSPKAPTADVGLDIGFSHDM